MYMYFSISISAYDVHEDQVKGVDQPLALGHGPRSGWCAFPTVVAVLQPFPLGLSSLRTGGLAWGNLHKLMVSRGVW